MKKHRIFAVALFSLAVLLCASISAQAQAQLKAQSTPSPVTTETQPGFTVLGYWVRTSGQKEAGESGLIPQLWQRVTEEGLLDNIPHRADSNFTVVYTDYSSDQNGEYTYVLGDRVTAVDKVPDGMIAVKVPAGKYAVITSETGPLPEIMPKLWQRIWAMTPAQLGGVRAFQADYELYPEGFDWQNAQVVAHVGLK